MMKDFIKGFFGLLREFFTTLHKSVFSRQGGEAVAMVFVVAGGMIVFMGMCVVCACCLSELF